MTRPVISIDGPSGAGKGTAAQLVAQALDWALLDSGALYRIVGYAATEAGIDLDDGTAVAELAQTLDISFQPGDAGVLTLLAGEDISAAIRTEEGGAAASRVAVHPELRSALMEIQRGFGGNRGLVADGRDMGTVVFPDAPLKIFLTASAEARAERRYKQLKDKGESVNLARLLGDIQERDERDRSRSVSPLLPADDAIVIDSTATPIDAVFDTVMADVTARFGI